MARRITRIDIEPYRAVLERWARSHTAPQRLVLRSRIVLLRAGGLSARDVADALAVSRNTVDLWCRRFATEGADALTRDRPGRGRKRRACLIGIGGPASIGEDVASPVPAHRQANSRDAVETWCGAALAGRGEPTRGHE
jgi:hypothetical protein